MFVCIVFLILLQSKNTDNVSLVMAGLNETIRAVIKEFHQCVVYLMKKLDRIIPEPYKYSITIMDIPEEIMRYIFSFLSDAELIILVRNTCRWFQFIIDKYVKIGICVRDIFHSLFYTILGCTRYCYYDLIYPCISHFYSFKSFSDGGK